MKKWSALQLERILFILNYTRIYLPVNYVNNYYLKPKLEKNLIIYIYNILMASLYMNDKLIFYVLICNY